MLRSIACRMNHHQPVRRDVKWDGENYVGNCRHCDAPIERYRRRRWGKRRDVEASQGNPTPV